MQEKFRTAIYEFDRVYVHFVIPLPNLLQFPKVINTVTDSKLPQLLHH
jgi:hypothetical protein